MAAAAGEGTDDEVVEEGGAGGGEMEVQAGEGAGEERGRGVVGEERDEVREAA